VLVLSTAVFNTANWAAKSADVAAASANNVSVAVIAEFNAVNVADWTSFTLASAGKAAGAGALNAFTLEARALAAVRAVFNAAFWSPTFLSSNALTAVARALLASAICVGVAATLL